MPKELIEIHLEGENIVPGMVRSRELAELILSTEDMIASVIVRDHPEITKDEVIIGLTAIEGGSISLRFRTPMPDLALPAYLEIAESVTNRNFEDLPQSSIESLQVMTAFSRRHNSELLFASEKYGDRVLAIVSPELVIAALPEITGFTVIYGRLLRVGGKTPTAMLDLPDGRTFYCQLERKSEFEIAQSLGQRLYKWVGLYGEAKWSTRDNSLTKFRVERITDFEDLPIDEAISKLSEAVGRHFSGIGDVEGYVGELRGTNYKESSE